jgi:hypothetical protein
VVKIIALVPETQASNWCLCSVGWVLSAKYRHSPLSINLYITKALFFLKKSFSCFYLRNKKTKTVSYCDAVNPKAHSGRHPILAQQAICYKKNVTLFPHDAYAVCMLQKVRPLWTIWVAHNGPLIYFVDGTAEASGLRFMARLVATIDSPMGFSGLSSSVCS